VTFYLNNETEVHEAVITQTGRSIGNDKTFRIYATVVSPCKNILSGMYVNAFVKESENIVPVLPGEAIVSFNDKDYIFSYEKEKEEAGKPFTEYKMIEVKRGVSVSGYSEVILPAGFNAKIVIKGRIIFFRLKRMQGRWRVDEEGLTA
jgi:cobalt-zinc-cadmium efflux system membrane fusion protein